MKSKTNCWKLSVAVDTDCSARKDDWESFGLLLKTIHSKTLNPIVSKQRKEKRINVLFLVIMLNSVCKKSELVYDQETKFVISLSGEPKSTCLIAFAASIPIASRVSNVALAICGNMVQLGAVNNIG